MKRPDERCAITRMLMERIQGKGRDQGRVTKFLAGMRGDGQSLVDSSEG